MKELISVVVVVSILLFSVSTIFTAGGSEIEELQRWIHDHGFKYTVAENWIMKLPPANRAVICGYKPSLPPVTPLPAGVDFHIIE